MSSTPSVEGEIRYEVLHPDHPQVADLSARQPLKPSGYMMATALKYTRNGRPLKAIVPIFEDDDEEKVKEACRISLAVYIQNNA